MGELSSEYLEPQSLFDLSQAAAAGTAEVDIVRPEAPDITAADDLQCSEPIVAPEGRRARVSTEDQVTAGIERHGGSDAPDAVPAGIEARGAEDVPPARGDDMPPPDPPDIAGPPTPGEDPESSRARAATALEVVDRMTFEFMLREAAESEGRLLIDRDGIFVPADPAHVLASLQAAEARPGQVFADIGSGDGRWPIAGAVLGLETYGYEHNGQRHQLAEQALGALASQGAISEAEQARVHLVNGDFFDADISDVDLFAFYDGSGPDITQIEDKLVAEAKPDAKVILYRSGPDRTRRLVPITPYIHRVPATGVYRILRPR